MTYAFTTAKPNAYHRDWRNDETSHVWEEWHAYLSGGDLPEWVDGSDSGTCCHTCKFIYVDKESTWNGAPAIFFRLDDEETTIVRLPEGHADLGYAPGSVFNETETWS